MSDERQMVRRAPEPRRVETTADDVSIYENWADGSVTYYVDGEEVSVGDRRGDANIARPPDRL